MTPVRLSIGSFAVLAGCAAGSPTPVATPANPSPDRAVTPEVDRAPPPASSSASGPSTGEDGSEALQDPSVDAGSGSAVLVGEIAAAKTFDPARTVRDLRPEFLTCYRRVLSSGHPGIHGKLSLRVVVSEAGLVQAVSALPGGPAENPALVSCLSEVLKGATFSKPGGTATIVVPLLFRL